MNISLTPKADFMSDEKKAGQWQDIVASPIFKEAVKSALLDYTLEVGGENLSEQKLGYVGVRIDGAKGFLRKLMNLGVLQAPQQDNSGGYEPLSPIRD